MKFPLQNVLILFLPVAATAQQPMETGVEQQQELPVFMVETELEDISFFVQTPSTSVIKLPKSVDYPSVRFLDPGPFRLLDYTSVPGSGNTGPVLRVRWYPLTEGLETFPAMEVVTDEAVYRTTPSQVLVKAPLKSSEISLQFIPEKATVYAGEPLRVDVVWRCDVASKRIRSVECYPSFLSDPEVEISVPRTTEPESAQLGLPFGGRRIIARREVRDEAPNALGIVSFPIFVRFPGPGAFTIEPARLQCAQLQQDGGPLAPYAAYYNNGLFEGVEKGVAYDIIYTESEPVEIEVLPLPEEGRSEAFSGLFMPCEVSAQIKPDEGNVGGLMDLDIIVKTPVASDFVALPPLKLQKGLRSWFKVDPGYTRTWLPDGLNFSTRIRALTTKVRSIPSLQFQVFDPVAGKYRFIETVPMPVTIQPQDGKDYFDASELLDTASNLTSREEGIWNNRGKANMHDLLEFLLTLSTKLFWPLLALGPVLFVIMLPRARESRRRELDPAYRAQRDAYHEFLRYPEGDIRKWHALKKLLAVSLDAVPGSWTVGDSTAKLADAGLDEKTIKLIRDCHRAEDTGEFSRTGKSASMPRLNDAGRTCFKVLRNVCLVVVAGLFLSAGNLRGQDWETAESEFAEALLLEPGSSEYYAAFSKAALRFEALGSAGDYPGMAWYNAGNSWFFSGEIGRAIACYKQAQVYRPFDPLIKENLKAARALAIDVVETKDRQLWLNWPVRWVALLLLVSSCVFWAVLLLYVRHRSRRLLWAGVFSATVALGLICLASYNALLRSPAGVVIVPEVFARKGPGYTYHAAFNEPLHDGVEFELVEARDSWIQVRLPDDRTCWIPQNQAMLVDRTF